MPGRGRSFRSATAMARTQLHLEHLLRRGGFGASPADLASFEGMSMSGVLDLPPQLRGSARRRRREDRAADVRRRRPRAAQFSPNTNIEDARQRWLFRMVHSQRRCRRRWRSSGTTTSPPPTARSPAPFGAVQGTKMMALKPGELPGPAGPDRAVPRARARQLPRSADRGREGSGDARLARRPH